MITNRRASCLTSVGASIATCLAAASGAVAQDVEMTAQVMGRPLPSAYYQRISERPEFFDIQRGWVARAQAAARANESVSGMLPIAVVLALFADSPEPSISTSEIQRVLFDGPAPNGTLSAFYDELSGGRLQIAGRVFPWVRTAITLSEAVGSTFGLGDTKTGEYLVDALARVDGVTDFGQFDNDGGDGVPNSGDDDGLVDALAFEFIEVSASCGGPGIWPHRSRISNWIDEPYMTDDLAPSGEPIRVDDYIVQSAVLCDGVEIQNARTIAHEMGHILGLPDLYDRVEGTLPTLRSWVVGCWSLMAAGAWGCSIPGDPVLRPPHTGPWEKMVLGWLGDLEVVGPALNREYELTAVQRGGKVLRVPLSGSEYLLVEYRPTIGFDQDLPAGGVLIYHIDENRVQRRCRACDRIYHVALEEADGNDALTLIASEGGNRGEPGDVFATAGVAILSNVTKPSTRLNSGAASIVTFYRIAVENDVARIRLSTTVVGLDRLLEPFHDAGADPLTAAEAAYLDAVGNGDGAYDLGDFRRYVLEHPAVVAEPAGGAQP